MRLRSFSLFSRLAPRALAAAGLIIFSSSTFAQYDATAYIPNGTVFGRSTVPGDVSYFYNSGNASATASFTSNPIASVNYTTTAFNPSGQIILSGGGIMTYNFTVAAQPFTAVPINFSGLFASSTTPASAGYGAFTSFDIQTVNSSVFTNSSFASFFRGDCGAPICLQYTTSTNTTYTSTQLDLSQVSGSFQGTLNMLTGASGSVTGSVQILASAGVNVFFVPASATAFIDPHLEIDSMFLAANPGASLSITAGVGNAISAVPEPATYALTLAGLVGLTVAAKRRRLGLQQAWAR
jgi:hypothetical protein